MSGAYRTLSAPLALLGCFVGESRANRKEPKYFSFADYSGVRLTNFRPEVGEGASFNCYRLKVGRFV